MMEHLSEMQECSLTIKWRDAKGRRQKLVLSNAEVKMDVESSREEIYSMNYWHPIVVSSWDVPEYVTVTAKVHKDKNGRFGVLRRE